MKKNFFIMIKSIICSFMLFLTTQNLNAQVGIGTTTPAASSALDISSTNSGLLTPRMTTAQKNAIVSPANGLLVYDTDLKGFSYYDLPAASWVNVTQGRSKFKRIKSTDVLADVLAAEFAAGGGSKYLLDSQTLYEINGTITLDKPIDLNNAYLQGVDSGDDKIVRTSGNIFDGANGGTIKGLTLVASAGKVLNLSGANTENLIFRDCIVANSNAVGTINGMGLVFLSVVQFSNNTTGITYSNISQLLLSNLGWFANSKGTFEKLTGTFGLVQKQGGFSDVSLGTFAFDVSGDPTISGDAVLESVVFTGDASGVKYVRPYSLALRYDGYNFSNSWNVRCAGIPTETDADATGDINLNAVLGTGTPTAFTGTGNTNPSKIKGSTSSFSLFRFEKVGDNKIYYRGNKTRYFQVTASVSYQPTDDMTLVVYIARNGVLLPETKVYGRGATGFLLSSGGILALPIVGTVKMNKNDYIEVWVQQITGGGTMQTVSLNLTAR